MTYKDMTIQDIIAWCKENNQVEWLKAEAAKKTTVSLYPRKKVVKEDGKVVSVADKSKEKYQVEQKITFIELKYNFCDKFMPEILPKSSKPKKPSMYDLIEEL